MHLLTGGINVFAEFWWLLLPICIVGWICKSRWAKGLSGEWRVRLIAWFLLDRNTYRRSHNVFLRTPDGATQIDHLFISRFGIFVLETKNMRGWIFGKADESQWTQQIYGDTFRFQNPLRQNFKHMKSVEAALDVPPSAIHSVIAFMGRCSLKTPLPDNVTLKSGFVQYIKSFQKSVFTEEQVDLMFDKIAHKRLSANHILSQMHVHNIRQRSNPKALRHCPKCGKRLIVRTAKHGAGAGHQFWACSGYPSCKFTQNIM